MAGVTFPLREGAVGQSRVVTTVEDGPVDLWAFLVWLYALVLAKVFVVIETTVAVQHSHDVLVCVVGSHKEHPWNIR